MVRRDGVNLDERRFGLAETHLIAHQLIFDGIMERSVEKYLNLLSADKAHLDEAFAEGPVAQYLDNAGGLARLKLR